MPSSYRKDGLVCSKIVQLCSASCSDLLVLKFGLRKVFLIEGLLWSCVASTLCLNVMPMFMLINDLLYICMLLIYLCYHHHHVLREREIK
jgi:hypothetical protein